ncbi:MAG: hypothetical protein JOZ58_22635 [Acetobacteraceae bacterium]|nr:hypothetical protein [Acetobacteraceae bacterium]
MVWLCTAEEVADVIAFTASPRAHSINAATFLGWRAPLRLLYEAFWVFGRLYAP